MDYTIRRIEEYEYPLLNEFLYEAIFIPSGMEAPPKSVINAPELQIYVEHFGEKKDDWGLVAEVNGNIAGAVWGRIINDYGHIDDETPSLAMSVCKEYRGLGIGTAMLKEMLFILKNNGYLKVSLSVQRNNYAVKMYQEAGFENFKTTKEEYVMVAYLK